MGEMILAMGILILFGWLNIIGVQKAAIVQTILSSLLVVCAVTLCITGLISAKATGINMQPIWGFDKSAAMAAGATTETIGKYAHTGTAGIMGFYLASSRLMYSMAREGYLPKWFGAINPKYGTPQNAMIFYFRERKFFTTE